MKKYFLAIYLAFINIISISITNSYPINIGPHNIHKYGNYNSKNVCLLNYNNVYTSFYKWSKDNKESQEKIINDTIWLNKNRFSTPNIVLGVYNSDSDLNYICLLRKLANGRFKILNIFANPNNDLEDDTLLFENILGFCIENKYSLNVDKLKEIDNSKYYFTYLYAYNCS
jgi:hypothetical protein